MEHPLDDESRRREAALPGPDRLPAGAADAGLETARTLPVIEESLDVRKVVVDQGGYRIDKRVEVREQLVDEPLRHERVEIERRAIGRTLADGEIPEARQDGDTWVVPVIEEVLVTVKRRVLVEEVRITRTRGSHHDPQRITLRKEAIEIERLGADIPVIRSS